MYYNPYENFGNRYEEQPQAPQQEPEQPPKKPRRGLKTAVKCVLAVVVACAISLGSVAGYVWYDSNYGASGSAQTAQTGQTAASTTQKVVYYSVASDGSGMQFTKEFNERTKNEGDLIIPVVITVYADRSFSFITKTPPAAVLILKACNIKSGSGVPNKTKVAEISKEDVRKIAELKMPDLNAASVEAAMADLL